VIHEKLSDTEIGALWTRYFPMRLNEPSSKAVCLAICLIVEERAARNATGDEDLLVEVTRALIALGIPRNEFYQAESDWPEEE